MVYFNMKSTFFIHIFRCMKCFHLTVTDLYFSQIMAAAKTDGAEKHSAIRAWGEH